MVHRQYIIKKALLVFGTIIGLVLFSLGIHHYNFGWTMSDRLWIPLSSKTDPGYWLQDCKCLKHVNGTNNNERNEAVEIPPGESLCGEEASFIGPGQKIISFSLFLKSPKNITFFANGLKLNLEQVQKLYPGWYLRIYTDIDADTKQSEFCDIICKNDQLIWCDVNKVSEYGSLNEMNPRMWRFLTFGDPTVDTLICRDLDSDISPRERAAVAEWENSSAIFHMMRDIKDGPNTSMLAGMLGVKNYRLTRWESAHLKERVITMGLESPRLKGRDEFTLRRLIYETDLGTEMLTHDSYFCKKYPRTVPFPTQREGNIHVGDCIRKKDPSFIRHLWPCPLECRPKHGQNWTYC